MMEAATKPGKSLEPVAHKPAVRYAWVRRRPAGYGCA